MNILLTGGTGFIGSYIAVELVRCGHHVTILARNQNKIPELKKMNRIEIVEGDINNQDLLEKLVQGKDACIHVTLILNDQSAREMLLADTLVTVTLADICARSGVKHFIYTSSAAANDFVYKTETARIGGAAKYNVYENTKQNPASYYGASKAATENYLNAISFQTPMKMNIVRPGFTFGNPVVEGAPIYSDKRFGELFRNAQDGKDVIVTKNDGTQFIWAGHLAEIYINILQQGVNRTMYFGLSKKYISWGKIAIEAIKMCHSSSKLIVEDKGWGKPIMFDVTAIKRDFNLEFDPWEKIIEHLEYYKSLGTAK
jgi:Nucleoside-diphosphate-sugar epimerases